MFDQLIATTHEAWLEAAPGAFAGLVVMAMWCGWTVARSVAMWIRKRRRLQ